MSRYPNTPHVAAIEIEEPGAADEDTIREAFHDPTHPGGAFEHVPQLRNLSGMLVKNGSTFYYVDNPYSVPHIHPESLSGFLPSSFRVRWRGQVGGYL